MKTKTIIKVNNSDLHIRDTFVRDIRHMHIAYVGKNGKAYNRKEKHRERLY